MTKRKETENHHPSSSASSKTKTAMSEAKEEEPTPTSPLPVDRHWIQKLLQKHPNPNARRTDKALVVAPMVDQSDLPFRLLCRRYGANLCFTPMIHSRLLVETEAYRNKFFSTDFDRPIIAQLCGSDPDTVLAAAKMLEPYVDGIDINCGCPQGIARRGNYGAFLLEQEDTLLTLVRHLTKHLRVPLSVKVRLLPKPYTPVVDNDEAEFDIPKASLALYEKLVDAGIHLLTIHGRTRKQKGPETGSTDWKTIRKAVDMFGDRIPIFANGSIQEFKDVDECLEITNADGIMSSESLLEYPPLFYKIPQTPVRTIGRVQLAEEYMQLAKQYPPNKGGQGSGLKCMRVHLHRFLHADLQGDIALRKLLVETKTLELLEVALVSCKKWHGSTNHDVASESLSWYVRHQEGDSKEDAEDDDDDEGKEAEEGTDMDEGIANAACMFGREETGDY
jgi:tRNA-dihydrouridine synthase 1